MEKLRKNTMMRRLLLALENGENIGHYGELVFAMIARHFLANEELVSLIAKSNGSEMSRRGVEQALAETLRDAFADRVRRRRGHGLEQALQALRALRIGRTERQQHQRGIAELGRGAPVEFGERLGDAGAAGAERDATLQRVDRLLRRLRVDRPLPPGDRARCRGCRRRTRCRRASTGCSPHTAGRRARASPAGRCGPRRPAAPRPPVATRRRTTGRRVSTADRG